MPSQRRNNTPGFTLIEIMVVLVILAVAAAIVAPHVASTSDLEAVSAARMVACDLQYAQDTAITTQVPVTVTFDGALPNEAYCVVTLDCGAQVCVRGLEGDIDRGGLVSTSDASIIKPKFGQTPSEASANVEFDFDVSGLISTSDFSQVKPKFGNAAPDCP